MNRLVRDGDQAKRGFGLVATKPQGTKAAHDVCASGYKDRAEPSTWKTLSSSTISLLCLSLILHQLDAVLFFITLLSITKTAVL